MLLLRLSAAHLILHSCPLRGPDSVGFPASPQPFLTTCVEYAAGPACCTATEDAGLLVNQPAWVGVGTPCEVFYRGALCAKCNPAQAAWATSANITLCRSLCDSMFATCAGQLSGLYSSGSDMCTRGLSFGGGSSVLVSESGCYAPCPASCNGRGPCVDGACVCASGYAGDSCADVLCPNACSGHGVCEYESGECQCHEVCAACLCPLR